VVVAVMLLMLVVPRHCLILGRTVRQAISAREFNIRGQIVTLFHYGAATFGSRKGKAARGGLARAASV